jgi:monoamine oxidase
VSAETDELDVAIVGGGAAGLYCAWRIVSGAAAGTGPPARPSGDGPLRVGVFEASARTGGRLYTVIPEGAPHLRAELGGIAIISTHSIVVAATEALGLEREPLVGGDPHALLHLRGRRFAARDWRDPATVPYELAAGERGRTPEEIFAAAVERVVPGAAELTAGEWDRVRRTLSVEGRPLAEIGLRDLVRGLVSPDAFQLLVDAAGFRPEFQNWNAADALVDVSGGWAVEARYERLRDGYEALPRALAREAEAGGARIETGHRLRAVEALEGDDERGVELAFELPGERRTVRARRAILAIGQPALEEVARGGALATSAELLHDLGRVENVPLFHLLLAYEGPWWEELGIRAGRSATDLPIQSCFYFGTEGDAGGAPSERRSLAMVGYSSPEAIAFWDRYLEGSDAGAAPREPPAEMLDEISRQLSAVHGIAVPDPYWARLMDWRPRPYGGASHRWAVGARSWEVIPRMRRPLPGLPLHVCGEAWSDLQGWVEGAFRSCERVLREELGLDPPGWLDADAHLGP